MVTEAALVYDGELHLPSRSTPIKIGSDEWRSWLKDAKKFRFSHSQGHEVQPGSGIISFRDLTFTAFRAGKDKPYWNAQRRKQGTLNTRYLGRDEDLTYEAMVEIALMLDKGSTKDEGKQRSLKSTRSESHSNDNYETVSEISSPSGEEIAKLKAENEKLHAEVNRLRKELETERELIKEHAKKRNYLWDKFKAVHAKKGQIQAELDSRCQQLALKSQECSELLGKLESSQPTALDSLSEYETNYETIKQTLPKPPKDVTRNHIEFWRFKFWLSQRLER